MAELLNVKMGEDEHGKFCFFSLSNQPQITFMCDIEDLELLRDGSYYVHISTRKKIYIRKNHLGKQLHFHREILNEGLFDFERLVDHKDRNTLNNRRYNLRVTDYRGNRLNSEDCINRGNDTGIPGLHATWLKRGFYQIYLNKKYMGSARTDKELQVKLEAIKNNFGGTNERSRP